MPTDKKLYVERSSIHARGAFAARDIKKGERIIQYTGRRLTPSEADRSNSDYVYQVNSRLYIDGKNSARYINHSCNPNCESDIEKGEIWICAIRSIKKDEELSYNYGFDMSEAPNYPCACGTSRCVGFILDDVYWTRFRKRLQKKKQGKSRKKLVTS